MSENRSRLGLITIAVTLVGVVVLLSQQALGLTIIFVAMLLYAITIVKTRLEAIGAEAFALGSIIVWLGFAFTGLPLIAFAWGFLDSTIQLISFIIGLLLIFIGYTSEYYDLNVRFLKFIRNVRENLREVLSQIRARLFRSIWTLLAFVFFILSILVGVMPDVADLVPNLLGFSYGQSLQFITLAVVSLLIEFRQLIWLGLTTVGRSLFIIIEAVWQRLRNLPNLIRDLVRFVYHQLKNLGMVIWNTTIFLRDNLYLLGLIGTVLFGLFGILREDLLLGASAIVLLLISLMNLLSTRGEFISQRIGDIQQSAYQRSFTIRNLIRRVYTGTCPNCGAEVPPNVNHCRSCGAFIPDCSVCRDNITAGEETLVCPNCETPGHADHLERWLSIRSICPNCRSEWS